jgi:hypothetical protein
MARQLRWVTLIVWLTAVAACAAPPPDPTEIDSVQLPLAQTRRELVCDTTAVTADELLPGVTGAPQLLLRPTGEPCRHDLVHRAVDGREHTLSARPGLTFLAAARAIPTATDPGRLVACWSDIQTRPPPRERPGGRASAPAPARVRRQLLAVDLLCRIHDRGRWLPPLELSRSANEDAAAWLAGLSALEDEPGAFRVHWTKDSSFTFHGDPALGRPDVDGLFARRVVAGTRASLDRSPPAERVSATAWDVDLMID